MVEYSDNTDRIFDALSDKTRRDILIRVSKEELSINQIAVDYNMSIAAVSKHVKILESSGLVNKRREGQKRFVSYNPESLKEIYDFFEVIY